MEDTDLSKDIEIQESVGLFFISKGIGTFGRLRIVLTSGVLVEIIEPASKQSQSMRPSIPSAAHWYTYVSPR